MFIGVRARCYGSFERTNYYVVYKIETRNVCGGGDEVEKSTSYTKCTHAIEDISLSIQFRPCVS